MKNLTEIQGYLVFPKIANDKIFLSFVPLEGQGQQETIMYDNRLFQIPTVIKPLFCKIQIIKGNEFPYRLANIRIYNEYKTDEYMCLALYREGEITTGQAAKILNITKRKFIKLCTESKIGILHI
uniref:Uncharacterized protein n=1 Tax=viral metagenome TaxID=1070528 RepID=A0A6H1ZND0_9ZZZZ